MNGKTGLTLGKYAPFHKGHAHVIETMLSENDNVIVIIYDTDKTRIPLYARAAWIKKLYPHIHVIGAWDGPAEPQSADYKEKDAYKRAWREYEKAEELHVRALLSEDFGEVAVDGFYSGEYYGAHMACALSSPGRPCADRRVDEARVTVPISATMIRENPYEHRRFVAPHVYWDMLIKVVFVGAMSTGKSTITEALAERYDTAFAPEYGRYYWEDHQVDRRISLEAFNDIAFGHIRLEEERAAANKYLFVDTNAITTYMYSLDYHGAATPELTRLALENASRYDLFFLCEDDIPYDDTWDRSGDGKRRVFHRQVKADLAMRRIPYITLEGTLDRRIAKVAAVLETFTPYGNYYGEGRTIMR
jgi:NadR type nicotinamide-nucleotide adenylyltransferase